MYKDEIGGSAHSITGLLRYRYMYMYEVDFVFSCNKETVSAAGRGGDVSVMCNHVIKILEGIFPLGKLRVFLSLQNRNECGSRQGGNKSN